MRWARRGLVWPWEGLGLAWVERACAMPDMDLAGLGAGRAWAGPSMGWAGHYVVWPYLGWTWAGLDIIRAGHGFV
jgi:hypothetical protein